MALDLAPAGLDAKYPLDVQATATCSSADDAIAIGDHQYSIAYGEYAWRAINEATVASYGYDLRGALGAAVGCPALANKIAAKCYYGYCVGHAAEITEICNKGLDLVVENDGDGLSLNGALQVSPLRDDALDP